jgi:hypothetical protein
MSQSEILYPFKHINTTGVSEKVASFNKEYSKYKFLNRRDYINPSIDTKVKETSNLLIREYYLLFIWFIIAIIFIILTIFSILSTELNSYTLYPALGFLIIIIFYIFKNIFVYLNELSTK